MRATRRWPAFVVLSTLLHGAVLASLSWIPIARGAAADEAGDEADDGYVIQLSLRPALTESSTEASAEAEPELALPTASDAEVAPEPQTAAPPPELASAPPPEPAFEIEPEPSPEPPPRVDSPVVTTIAEAAPALAQGPTPPAPEAPAPSAPRSEEMPAVPASSTPAATSANPSPTQAPATAPAASEPKPAASPGSATSNDAASAGVGALDDGLHLRALRSDRPEYPEDARRRSEQGTVTCRLTIDRDGRVVEVELLVSSGSAALDRAALRALKRWRFEPLARITDRERVHAVQKLAFELKSARP